MCTHTHTHARTCTHTRRVLSSFNLHSLLLRQEQRVGTSACADLLLWGLCWWVSVWGVFQRLYEIFFFSVKEPRCLTPGKYFWIITIIFVNDFPSTICSALSHLCSLFLTICYLYIAMLFWSQSFPVFSIFTLFRCFILQIWGLLNRLFQAY